MKKLVSTLALVLAISSVSMAKSSSKKVVSHSTNTTKKIHKIVAVKATFMCDGNHSIVGVIFSDGSTAGDCGPNTCVC